MLFTVLVVSFFGSAVGWAGEDLIQSLPGVQFNLQFNQFSGYLNARNNTYLHYWFVQSQNNNATDPVVLWLNGGPGCSSLIGLMTENGPYRLSIEGDRVYENVFSWNKIANVLYLESPAGVGFSYKIDGTPPATDNETSFENYEALLDFFNNKFPEYKGKDFWITGESYGGYYVPTLAQRILSDSKFPATLKGVAIGNGFLGIRPQIDSLVRFFYYHGIIGQDLWTSLETQCCNSSAFCDYVQYFTDNSSLPIDPDLILCTNLTSKALEARHTIPDEYNIYFSCYERSNTLETLEDGFATASGDDLVRMTHRNPAHPDRIPRFDQEREDNRRFEYCRSPEAERNATNTYFNQKIVQDAIHILPGTVDTWSTCNMDLHDAYTTQFENMYEQFNLMLKKKIKILLYNGDVDSVCNFLSAQLFAGNLGLTMMEERKPWYFEQEYGRTAGYVKRYNGLDLLTVRGAGHFVPQYKPREALQMFANFIRGKDYSTDTNIPVEPVTSTTTTNASMSTMNPASTIGNSTTTMAPTKMTCPKCPNSERSAAAALGVLFGIFLAISIGLGFCLYKARQMTHF